MKHYYLPGLIIFLLSFPVAVSATEPGDSTHSRRWYLPHFVPVQFAGNIGLFSLGVGYNSNHQNYQLSILYGHVPASIARSNIHTITAKNFFPITRYQLRNNQTLIPYLGVGLTVEIGGNAFFRMPSHFPDGYYDFPKNLHLIAYGGARLQRLFPDKISFLRGIEFYAEAGTVDIYVWYKAMSRDIRFNEIFSLAFGVNLLLDN